MKEREKLPSDVIAEFCSWLKDCQTKYDEASVEVEIENEKEQDFLHAIEFETNGNKIAKIARELHDSRVKRREGKNILSRYGKLVKFTRTEQNKKFLGQLKGLVKELKEEESSFGTRQYHPRSEFGKKYFERGDSIGLDDRSGQSTTRRETRTEARDAEGNDVHAD